MNCLSAFVIDFFSLYFRLKKQYNVDMAKTKIEKGLVPEVSTQFLSAMCEASFLMRETVPLGA